MHALGGRIPLYTGLYVPDLPPPDLAKAIERAFAGGASGVSLFQGDMLTPEYLRDRAGDEGAPRLMMTRVVATALLALFALRPGEQQSSHGLETLPFAPQPGDRLSRHAGA